MRIGDLVPGCSVNCRIEWYVGADRRSIYK